MKTIKIRIPMIVTQDGKWAANGSHSMSDGPDWSYIDEMCDYENPTVNPRRYWIETEVIVHEADTVTASVASEHRQDAEG